MFWTLEEFNFFHDPLKVKKNFDKRISPYPQTCFSKILWFGALLPTGGKKMTFALKWQDVNKSRPLCERRANFNSRRCQHFRGSSRHVLLFDTCYTSCQLEPPFCAREAHKGEEGSSEQANKVRDSCIMWRLSPEPCGREPEEGGAFRHSWDGLAFRLCGVPKAAVADSDAGKKAVRTDCGMLGNFTGTWARWWEDGAQRIRNEEVP